MALSSNTKKLFIRILLFLVYLLLGAAIFYGIEHGNEEKLKDSNNFAVQYKNFTDHYKISKEDMVEFIDELQKALKLGYNVSEERWTQYNRWDFMNAFHFAGNVVTTIGYGHITPVTVIGQIICIFYALLGIPLTGLTLRSIGNRISEYIAANIKSLDRRIYNRETEKLEIKTAVVAFGCLLLIILIPAIGFSQIEKWQYTEAVYFCFVTLTTIGFGDFVPGSYETRRRYGEALYVLLEFLNLFYMVLGLAVMSGVIVSISGVIEEKTKNFGVDPLEALKNIRVENLNSRALKKLGYKMGPGGPQGGTMNHDMDRPRANRLPPKLAPRSISGTNNTMERSRSAETMEFQGPTPVMYLNKRTGNDPNSTDNVNTGSPPTSKLFNNKIAPVTLPESYTNNADNPNNNTDARKSSDDNSTSTESAEEARASDEDNEVAKTMNGSVEIRQEAELDGLETFCEEPKNNLVVQVQVTPMPSPRESPVPARSSFDSIPLAQVKSGEADSEPIETYEGSIDSASHPFQIDRTDSLEDDSKLGEFSESGDSKNTSISQTDELKNGKNTFHKPRTKELTTDPSRARNGFISKSIQTKPVMKKAGNGRIFRTIENIDLGDKSVTKR